MRGRGGGAKAVTWNDAKKDIDSRRRVKILSSLKTLVRSITFFFFFLVTLLVNPKL